MKSDKQKLSVVVIFFQNIHSNWKKNISKISLSHSGAKNNNCIAVDVGQNLNIWISIREVQKLYSKSRFSRK